MHTVRMQLLCKHIIISALVGHVYPCMPLAKLHISLESMKIAKHSLQGNMFTEFKWCMY